MIAVRVLADSINPVGIRLTSLEIHAPRVPCWEHVLTHRALSRNASSHRAIPVAQLIERSTVAPTEWGAAQTGMVAERVLSEQEAEAAARHWNRARVAAGRETAWLGLYRVHKQVANRLMRPFEVIEAVVSATDWRNFLTLRTAPDAEPETRALAEAIRDALAGSTPAPLRAGWWHLPYATPDELAAVCAGTLARDELAAACAMRCARVSRGLRTGGEATVAEDAAACRAKLVARRHWSPLEHPARALGTADRVGNYRGFAQLRKDYPGEDGE